MMRPASIVLGIACLALAACNNTAATLDPSALQPVGSDTQQIATPTAPQQPPSMSQQAPARTAAIAPGSAVVHFAPVVGATETAADPLARRLADQAAARGIRLVPAGSAGTTHQVKGYFSAFTEGRETTVIYVWDVLDTAGNRVHRIQGQQKVNGGAGEGWSAVDAPAMQVIADRTVDDLVAWLASRQG